nr:unnamed protein product [Naegleria fowleri]
MERYYTQCPSELAFSIPRFQELLKTKNIGRCFIYREQVESTMDVAKAQAEEKCPTGTLILAEEQDSRKRKDVTVIPADSKSAPYSAKAVGISKFGNLLVELNDGSGVKELVAEEVSIRPIF